MPAKSTKAAQTAKASRSSMRNRSGSRSSSKTQSRPDHDAIAERAYFIHLEDGGSDEFANWLRAERELTTV